MAIERAIYGSLSCGIEGENTGYQYFTYTANYKDLINSSNVQGKMEASYVAPQTFVAYNALMQKPEEQRNVNVFADEIMNEHPKKFAYWIEEIGGVTKACFSYGKNMGMDWTGTRPNPIYAAATIADISDVRNYPVSYSASPSIACDVRRSEFYPDNGVSPTPHILSNITSMDADDANIVLQHTAAFSPIEMVDIQKFLAWDNRMDSLKGMLTALMKFKDGNEQCRVMVADKKENTIYWIAAISYVFPLENVLKFSFSTYESSDFSYDFNGIFRCRINNIEDDNYEPTSYDFNRCCVTHAVFDFQEGYNSDKIALDDSPFFIMLERAYSMNLARLDEYKNFVVKYTKYRELNSKYMDGYNLYVLCSKKSVSLEFDELVRAYNFAKEYASKEVCKTALDVLFEIYPKYLENDGLADLLKDFINFSLNCGLLDRNFVNNRFLGELLNSFSGSISKEEFYQQGEFVEKICSWKDGLLESEFIKQWGIASIEQQIDQIGEPWKYAFIQNALCHYIAKGNGSLDSKTSSKLARLFYVLAYYVTEYNDNYIQKKMDHVNKILNNPCYVFTFADIMNEAFAKKIREPVLVEQYVSNWYCNSDISAKTKILQAMQQNNVVTKYIPYILNYANQEMELKRFIEELRVLVDTNAVYLGKMAFSIKNLILDAIETDAPNCPEPRYIYDAYVVLLNIEEKYRINLVQSDFEVVLKGYILCLDKKYKNMNITKEEMEQMKAICDNIPNSFLNGKMNELIMICISYGYIRGLNKDATKKPKESRFYKADRERIPNICSLPESMARKFMSSAIEAAGIHWIETDHFPEMEVICQINDPQQIREVTTYYYRGMLTYILEQDKGKEKASKAATIIKRAYFLDTDDENTGSSKKKKLKLSLVTEFAGEIARDNALKAVIRELDKDCNRFEGRKKVDYVEGIDYNGMEQILNILDAVYDSSQKGFMDTISDFASGILQRFKRE